MMRVKSTSAPAQFVQLHSTPRDQLASDKVLQRGIDFSAACDEGDLVGGQRRLGERQDRQNPPFSGRQTRDEATRTSITVRVFQL
jgi:hypothetical protein